MPLPTEQIQQIKQQLITQIEATFPPDKKDAAIQQINSMNPEELEQFLIQNKLIKSSQDNAQQTAEQQCVFCSIADEKIQSHKIDENKDAVAVLELNPLSKGHVLIIPKKHIASSNEIPQTAFSLAKKISKKIKTKLKPSPNEIKMETSVFMNHAIINIIPIYKDTPLEKQKATEEELLKLQNKLEKKSKPKLIKKPKTVELRENIKLPKRIP